MADQQSQQQKLNAIAQGFNSALASGPKKPAGADTVPSGDAADSTDHQAFHDEVASSVCPDCAAATKEAVEPYDDNGASVINEMSPAERQRAADAVADALKE